MKKVIAILIFFSLAFSISAQEFMQVTSVESIIPGGIGRSRLITTGKDGKMEEIKLENFYSLVGINFGNINSNDIAICNKLTDLAKEGWELIFVTTGVESDAGKDDGNGIFITRYIFKREKK